jgi:predicted membrane-bound spermidine synthase
MDTHAGQGADERFQSMPLFFIDGHVSHPLQPEGETIFGLLAARAFDHPFHRSLVLGLGSGQSALGVSMISDGTDVVEISPSVFDMLARLEQFNRKVGKRADVHLIRADGTDFLRTCAPGSYDLVSNTVTYPVMFASYKMYTTEAVRDAHRCLAPGGVYQGFIAGTMRMNRQYWKDSLAPIYQNFKYVYVSTQPYLTYVASDRPLQLPESLDLTHVVKRAADLDYLVHDERILRSLACAGWLEPPQDVRPDATTKVTTLDDPVIERDNTEWSLKSLGPYSQLGLDMAVGHLFEPYLPYLQNEQCWNIDGMLQAKAGAPAVIHPPLVPLLRGPAQH